MGNHTPSTRPAARSHAAAGLLWAAGALALALPLLPGCADRETPSVDAAPASHQAVAVLEPTRTGRVRGTIEFESLDDADEGVRVRANVKGLPPGRHAFHVHVKGDCSAPDASSAGPHFAFEAIEGEPDRIAGNLGELETNASGSALLETVVSRARLAGERSIVGRAVVVHAEGNDPSVVPDGDAGERIACGVIEVASGKRS